jgi:drug/metabolite transporter (DMT)-like permease
MANPSVLGNKNRDADRVPLRTWIGVAASMLGAFMAVLDIQITNSSLQDIQESESGCRGWRWTLGSIARRDRLSLSIE